MRTLAWGLLALSLAVHAHAAGPDDWAPADSGNAFITCNGTNDGAAMRSCAQNAGSNYAAGKHNVCRLPSGACQLNLSAAADTVAWRQADGTWQSNLCFVGAGSALTTLRVIGSFDQSTPVPALYAASKFEPGTSDDPAWNSNGSGNKAFLNCISGMTIDLQYSVGVVPIDFIGNNSAHIRDVVITSSQGSNTLTTPAIKMTRYGQGPALLERVSATGHFRRGLDLYNLDYGVTLVETGLQPISLWQNVIFGRNMAMHRWGGWGSQAGPALMMERLGGDPWALGAATIVDSQMPTGLGSADAIGQVVPTTGHRGMAFVKNTTWSGYASLLGPAAWSSGSDWAATVPVMSAFTADDKSPLNIARPTKPAFPSHVPSDWGKCTGCNSTDAVDDSAAIQAALGSGCTPGKPIVYLVSQTGTSGARRIIAGGTTIHIPSGTKVLHLEHGTVEGYQSANTTFDIDSGDPNSPLLITSGWCNGCKIVNASNRPVHIQDMIVGSIEHLGTGPMWLTNVSAQGVTVQAGSKLYYDQLDCESGSATCFQVHGGVAAGVGLHGESGGQTLARVDGGGCLEVYGSSMYMIANAGNPVYDVVDSKFFATFSGTAYGAGYGTLLREKRGATTQTVTLATAATNGALRTNYVSAVVSAHQGACPL